MNRASLLYDNQKSTDYIFREVPLFIDDVNTGESPVDSSVYEALEPLNPVTGFRDNCLSRLLSSNVSVKEREFILNTLTQIKGYSSPAQLTDDDLLEILPSRYAQDPVELERFRTFVDSVIESSKESVEPPLQEEPPVDSSPVEPVS